ncbi:Sulfhydryl oxidase [Plasmodium coatneyi]|uniref:Sulfhydryl oxidase n=1 Tax=Plasmodium coatneyi TaxID=208452 RepID=A0A1B1E7B1_9APIC|nr:Sulfhydryl oxidase [Plasmodium coatneyi]ANQ10873.1 Sulfhydryl oxidase [Plasmodium coatneyi]
MVALWGGLLRVLLLLYIILANLPSTRSVDVCKGAEETLSKFWNTIDNAKHGNVILINIKNYYCPACNRYIDVWNKLEEEISNYESNVTLFVFDCSCNLFVPYCRFFKVRYFPTFRLLHPVYDYMDSKDTEYKYIAPNTEMVNRQYDKELLLAYREVDRVNNLAQFQRMMQTHLCKNVNFNHIDLKSCYADVPPEEESPEYAMFIASTSGPIGGITGKEGTNTNRMAVERWKGMTFTKDNLKHDIVRGMLFTLRKNISLGLDVDKSTVEPFLVMTQIVSDMYPELAEWLSDLREELASKRYPLTYEQWSKVVDELAGMEITTTLSNDADVKSLVGDTPWNEPKFKVCEENSVLCSYWLLFHKISIHCLMRDKERYHFYINALTNYTKNYLNCESCIQHFVTAQESCYYGFCNIHSAESFVIFLWRIHNAVTLRSMYEAIIQETQVQGGQSEPTNSKTEKGTKFLNRDLAFPPEKQCKFCRSGIGFTRITPPFIADAVKQKSISDRDFDAIDGFSVKQVLNHLVKVYS